MTPGNGRISSRIEEARAAVAAGEIIGVPTDTVYGLAVDPRRPSAVTALYAAKGRPESAALPVLVATTAEARALASTFPPALEALGRRFWPGPLTIVVPRAEGGVDLDLGGDPRTIGLRVPANPVALALLGVTGPLAVTSANRHGEPPLTSASSVRATFRGLVPVVLDGGICDGRPSTVARWTPSPSHEGGQLECVREGALRFESVLEVFGCATGRPSRPIAARYTSCVQPTPSPLEADPELSAILGREVERQRTTIQLIASENFTSPAVLAATASVLTNKYSEGYPGRRYYGGNTFADESEELARRRAKELFGAEHANVQPHAGASANLAAYLTLVDPGDTILAMRLDQGGHLTHGSPVSITGKLYRFVAYGVTPAADDGSGERIDLDLVRDLALREQPKLIVAGTTAYSRIIDPAPFREIADEVGARFMFDAAHPAGLIAGGVHPSPVGIADVVTFTTHKTLRGPRGGAILCSSELASAIDAAVFPGLQGGPLEHVITAKAAAFREASLPEFRAYAAQVVTNAKALAAGISAEGFRLVAGGTENHQVLLDLRSFDADLTGKVAQEVLDRSGLTCNRNQIPGDPRSPFVTSGLRLGTAAETTAGMGPAEMAEIASLLARALRSRDEDTELGRIREEVRLLCSKFDPYPGGIG